MFSAEMSTSLLKGLKGCRILSVFCQYGQQQSSRSLSTSSPLMIKPYSQKWIDVADTAVEEMSDPKFKAKKHPGAQLRGTVVLPAEFSAAAELILSREGLPSLQTEAKAFDEYLISRRLPIEHRDYRSLAQKVENKIKEKDAVLERFLTQEQQVSLNSKHIQQTKFALRQLIYHWEPIKYEESECLQYLICRAAPEYAALYKIFTEISKRDPDFEPYSFLDFGSGLSTSLWAAQAMWNKSLKEHFCVDASRDMNDISELILRGCHKERPLIFPNTFYRQFLPESQQKSYDLVTSAYSLLDLPSMTDRIKTINQLWRKCAKYLVIVERGTQTGMKLITEAREFVLKLDRRTKSEANGHVFSPCPHDYLCPRVLNDPDGRCRFHVQYRPLIPFAVDKVRGEIFSYVVFKKELRNPDEEVWPRLVTPPKNKKHVSMCNLCMPDGKLCEVSFSRGKSNSRALYKAARRSKWGDLLPIKELPKDSLIESTKTREGGDKEDYSDYVGVEDFENKLSTKDRT